MAGYDFRKIRLFVGAPLTAGAEVPLGQDQHHYLVHVMRAGEGTELLAFNGRDGEWRVRLTEVGKRDGRLVCEEVLRPQRGVPDVDYLFAPLKRAPIDYVIQKVTELGARRIRPVRTRHTIAARINRERLEANAVEAAEQTGRLEVPQVLDLEDLGAVLDGWPPERRLLFCDEGEGVPMIRPALEFLSPADRRAPWAILIGPEGGFHEEERARLRALPGVHPVSLGPRIMRADTAGLAALALWQAHLGDW